MRIHTTTSFQAAREKHRAAYAAMDALPEGTDYVDGKWAAECDAEGDAMIAFLMHPARTPTDIREKLRYMRERDVNSGWTDYPAIMAQVERDLIELQRPCVSPAMADAFASWREAHIVYNQHFGEATVVADEKTAQEAHTAAFITMMQMPCYTPGDFIVKVYANQLGEQGSTICYPGGFLFELDDSTLDEGLGSHDGAAEEAFARDVRDCDLGRCLLALGRIDFDAEAWLVAAQRAQLTVHVVIERDGSRGLWTGEPRGEVDARHAQRFHTCQALLGAGMGSIGAERRTAVIAHIEEACADLVMDCRKLIGEAA